MASAAAAAVRAGSGGARHQASRTRIDAGRHLGPEAFAQRGGRRGDVHDAEAEPAVERRVEGKAAEGRQADARQAVGGGPCRDRIYQPATQPLPAVIRIDGELAEPQPAVERPCGGKARRRVFRRCGDEQIGLREAVDEGLDARRLLVGQRGIAMAAKQLTRAMLDRAERGEVPGARRTDAVARRQRPRQASYPSTIVISESATVTRMALAAWYSGEL